MQLPKLKDYRERKGLTQAELAELAGVSLRGIAGYEANDRGMNPNTARKLAEALEVDIPTLMGDEPSTNGGN